MPIAPRGRDALLGLLVTRAITARDLIALAPHLLAGWVALARTARLRLDVHGGTQLVLVLP